MTEMPPPPPQHYCDAWDCRRRTDDRCKKCQHAFYCSRAHQKDLWAHHKLLCGEMERVVDGDVLCNLILKTLEDVSPALDGLHYVQTDIAEDRRHIAIRLHRETVDRHLVDCFDKFCPPSQRQAEDEEKAKLARLSYWALRCASEGFTLNYTLWHFLCAYKRAGYTHVQFGTRRLSLTHEPRLDMLHLKPDRLVTRQVDDEATVGPADGEQYHFVASLDRHALDLAVGQFWVFDQTDRPLIVVLQKELYLDTVGSLVSECYKKRQTCLEKMLEQNKRIAPLRAILESALVIVVPVEEVQ